MKCLICRLRDVAVPEGATPEDIAISLLAARRCDRQDRMEAPMCAEHEGKIQRAVSEARRRAGPRLVLARN